MTAVILGLVLALVGGCGNSRTPLPRLSRPATPHGFRTLSYPTSGVSFRAPRDWTVSALPQPPLVTVLTSGTAVVAVSRFPLSEPVPGDPLAFARARRRVIRAARARDPTLRVIRSGVARIAGDRAIELDVIERIGGALRRVRSTHVFVSGAELVLEEYAPIADFHTVDHAVFSPLRRSLRLSPAGVA